MEIDHESNITEPYYKNSIHINTAELISHLKCPLCKGIFRKPTTINECMHSFCKSCIYKWFYEIDTTTRDYCPVCDRNLGGRPLETLIFDSSLSTLVEILFPQFDELDSINREKMYKAFRDNNEPLPGDTQEKKNNNPNVKISLSPLQLDDCRIVLPAIDDIGLLFVQKNMNILSLKAYLKDKLNARNQLNLNEEEISISYKNQEMPSNYTIDDIEKLYEFHPDKTVFYYARKTPLIKPLDVLSSNAQGKEDDNANNEGKKDDDANANANDKREDADAEDKQDSNGTLIVPIQNDNCDEMDQ